MVKRILIFVAFFVAVLPQVQANCEKIRLSGVNYYMPYSWSTADGLSMQGALMDLFEKLSSQAAVNFEVVNNGPWARALEELREGHTDALIGIFHVQEREAYMDYIYPAAGHSEGRIWLHESLVDKVQTLDDLRGLRGVAVANYMLGEKFDRYEQEHLRVQRVSAIEQAIKMVSANRADYFFYEELPAEALIYSLKKKNLVKLPLDISSGGMYLVFSKKSSCNTEDIKQRFAQALSQAQQENWLEPLIKQAQMQWKKKQKQND